MQQDTYKENQIIEIQNNSDLTKTYQKVKSDLPKYWDKDFINFTINKIVNPRHQILFRFLWMSGVRISECINIKKGDIDFDNYTLNLKWLKSRKYNYRNAPMHPTLRNFLQLYTAAMKENDFVFPISRQRAWQLTQKYFKGNPHQFRHSFAVNWLRSSGDVFILSKVLGHSKIQTTMEYLKIVPVDQGKELLKISFD